MPPALQIDRLGKAYTLRHNRAPGRFQYRRLSEDLAHACATPFRSISRAFQRKPCPTSPNNHQPSTINDSPSPRLEQFWALRDVSFAVAPGEAIGIIGRNGAGKSTLLKILSRITEPSEGRVTLRGRVASLLEVGTGFHPELTGRENIFLNGAILGMTRAEIRARFDEIVAFAEIEQFLDTPVKRYSSGMYVRLAFAVAAHLDPEILIVDEVLAVGDAGFQRKCLGRMQSFGEHDGRTVLFVSHQMEAITRLCKRAILLDQGRVVLDGPAPQVVAAYIDSFTRPAESQSPRGARHVELDAAWAEDEQGNRQASFDIRKPVVIRFRYWILGKPVRATHGLNLFNDTGIHVLSSHDLEDAARATLREPGLHEAAVTIPGNLLAEGHYTVAPAVFWPDPLEIFLDERAASFFVTDPIEGDSARGHYHGIFPGVTRPILNWSSPSR